MHFQNSNRSLFSDNGINDMITTVKRFEVSNLKYLNQLASRDARRRKNHNMHSGFDDPIQYFVNNIFCDSYIRPHRHDLTSGEEIIVSLHGTSCVLTFSDTGIVQEFILLAPYHLKARRNSTLMVTLPPMTWHTVIPLDDHITLLEIKRGPFNPDAAKIPASWAPSESDEQAQQYLSTLVNEAKDYFFG